jgi:hypothetical protein
MTAECSRSASRARPRAESSEAGADLRAELLAARAVLEVRPAAFVEMHANLGGDLAVYGAANGLQPTGDVLACLAQRGRDPGVGQLVQGNATPANADCDVHVEHVRRQARSAAGRKGGLARTSLAGSMQCVAGMEQPPQHSVDDELVDEVGDETFPASDAPGWSPTHAGGPFASPLATEHGPEAVRALLRADVVRLSRSFPDFRQRRSAREETVAHAMLGAGRAVVREPVDEGLEVRTVESEQLGIQRDASSVLLGARYDLDDVSGVAALLALARALAPLRLMRSVRFVAFADAPPRSGSGRYAERLWVGGVGVHAMVSLVRLDLTRDRDASLLLIGGFRSASLVGGAGEAFRRASRVGLRTLSLPAWLPGLRASDYAEFVRRGWPSMMVVDRPPWRARRAAGTPDVDRIAAAIPGLVAMTTRLAGGSGSGL